MSVRLLILVTAVLLTISAHGQIRCSTDILEQKALQKNPRQRIEFESWMKKKLRDNPGDNIRARTNSTYIIPVVVHILHNGEPLGSGSNIPDAQVTSQIRVLNEDYQRLNADASNTPAEFAPVAAGIDIEFVLAKQDPEGLPTNGITRTLAGKNGYTITDRQELTAVSYWPAEDYFNIWVTNLTDDHLGFAQFPDTDLEGPTPPYDRETDGVVIHYRAFGSSVDGAFNLLSRYSKGRTTTHEVGHFFSLLHTFGDGNGCGTTDYVDDTPLQSSETLSCPSSPVTQCSNHIMFQNYLDYTDDACMNMFTAHQLDRLVTVLANSPRRASLLISDGAEEPVVYSLDLEAKSIAAPASVTCGQAITPRLVVRNRGTSPVTSVRVSFILNGTTIETKDFTLNLNNLESTSLSFNTINLTEPSTPGVSFSILQVNGGADNDPSNNSASHTSNVSARITPPYIEAFNNMPSNWQVINPDNQTTWTNVIAPKTTTSNRAMYIDLYNYQFLSAKDQFVSPFFTIPNADAVLKFDRAYAMFQNVSTEKLRVLVSTGCSADLSEAVEIYSKSGADLATTAKQSVPFVPTGESQWSSDAVSLVAYVGKNIRLIFEATNANGNNLYFDNVQLTTGDINDVRVISVLSPGPVLCNPAAKPVIEVQNLGTKLVNRLQVVTEVNGIVSASQTVTGLAMTPGALITLTLQALHLTQSTNNIKITITDPDALSDDLPSNNVLSFTRIFNTASEAIPLRQNFDNDQPGWTIFSEGSAKKWEATTTNTYQNGLVFKGFTAGNDGDESWFVSPVLDFTKATEGSLFFTTSYGQRGASNEQLRVLVSEDCGENYTQVIFDKSGDDLANEDSGIEWKPADETGWRTEYISTNDFAGKKNLRFAFVAGNDNGNNLYLDNIEFFIEDNPDPLRRPDPLTVYNSETNLYEFKIIFNLPEKQDARLLIYNTLGQILVDSELPGTLNQTYTVNLYGQSSGVYVVRLLTPSQTSTAKLFVGR
ncbi:MAG TPA: choice-of-anchor J domain-containing protein [Cyclobacteriaceae bacterium]|nr:choice-of-anchor J domain-containing protein [Cyclobacteriaceae bacterium]